MNLVMGEKRPVYFPTSSKAPEVGLVRLLQQEQVRAVAYWLSTVAALPLPGSIWTQRGGNGLSQ
jgi:hypothetical protein